MSKVQAKHSLLLPMVLKEGVKNSNCDASKLEIDDDVDVEYGDVKLPKYWSLVGFCFR